jgi:hypothetical protein
MLVLSGSIVSCSTVEDTIRENPRTAIGTTVGALGGAIIGGTVFDTASAAVVGGLLGGLAGGVVGRALETRNEDYASTARDYDYWRRRETLVRLEDVDTDPARAMPRDTVHLVARYALLPSDGELRIKVTERWAISHSWKSIDLHSAYGRTMVERDPTDPTKSYRRRRVQGSGSGRSRGSRRPGVNDFCCKINAAETRVGCGSQSKSMSRRGRMKGASQPMHNHWRPR